MHFLLTVQTAVTWLWFFFFFTLGNSGSAKSDVSNSTALFIHLVITSQSGGITQPSDFFVAKLMF